MPHLELSQHPIKGNDTYDDYIGTKALRRKGKKKWNRHVNKAKKMLQSLLHFDILYFGGGNSKKAISPPTKVLIASNQAGITGGISLWDDDVSRSHFHCGDDCNCAQELRDQSTLQVAASGSVEGMPS